MSRRVLHLAGDPRPSSPLVSWGVAGRRVADSRTRSSPASRLVSHLAGGADLSGPDATHARPPRFCCALMRAISWAISSARWRNAAASSLSTSASTSSSRWRSVSAGSGASGASASTRTASAASAAAAASGVGRTCAGMAGTDSGRGASERARAISSAAERSAAAMPAIVATRLMVRFDRCTDRIVSLMQRAVKRRSARRTADYRRRYGNLQRSPSGLWRFAPLQRVTAPRGRRRRAGAATCRTRATRSRRSCRRWRRPRPPPDRRRAR